MKRLWHIITLWTLSLFFCTPGAFGQPPEKDLSSLNEQELLAYSLDKFHHNINPTDSLTAFRQIDLLMNQGRSPVFQAIRRLLEAKYMAGHGNDSLQVFERLQQTMEIAHREELKIIMAYTAYQMGSEYYKRKNYLRGIEELLNANEVLKNTGYGKMPEVSGYLFTLSNMYCDYQEYPKALQYLFTALQYPTDNQEERYNILGTIGLAYYRLDKTDSSIYYSSQALDIARKIEDTAKIGSMSGNIGIAYFRANNYPAALHYLHEDYRISRQQNQLLSAASSQLVIAKVFFEQDNFTESIRSLDTVQQLLKQTGGSYNIYWELYKLLSNIYLHKKDYYKAASYQDSFIRYNQIFTEKSNSTIVRGLELKVSSAIHETQIRLLESEKKRQLLLRNAFIVATLLIIVIVLQMIYRLRQKQKSERRIFAITLDNAEKKLASYIQSLREKNNLLEQFEAELVQIKNQSAAIDTDKREAYDNEELLSRIHNATLITEEAWQEFTGLVDTVHKNFFIRLRQTFPDLTPAETRLLTLIKLQFATKEMAAMLGISQDSVKKARQRVRKKINIAETEDLYDLLKNI